jgi:hypothetical protein
MKTCENFKREFSGFMQSNSSLINSITNAIDQTRFQDELSEFHFDLASDLKGVLGSDAANECADSDEFIDAALDDVDYWVTANISNIGQLKDSVGLSLWLSGLNVGPLIWAKYFTPSKSPILH